MSTILCAGYISDKDLALARTFRRAPYEYITRELLQKAISEACEGRPLVRVRTFDGQLLTRSEWCDNHIVLVECEADG